MMDVAKLLELITSNPERALFIIYGAKKLSQEIWNKISKKYKEVQKLKKFGCTPSDELATKLIKIDGSESFCRLKKIIGNHETLKVVRIGLYLEKLNKEGVTSLVKDIKNEIWENHSSEGMNLINMGSSGLLSPLIEQLETLKETNKLSKSQLIKEYEYAIQKLDDISIWVNRHDLIENIMLRIKRKMKLMRPKIFFIIAAGNASTKTAEAIAKLNNQNQIRERGYMVFQPQITPFGHQKSQYLWTFYKFV